MQGRHIRSLSLCAAVSSIALLAAWQPSFAQEGGTTAQSSGGAGGLEEIVVTVRRRAEVIQNVPVAVTALSGKDLEQKSITSANDIQFHVPELQVNPSQYLLSAE